MFKYYGAKTNVVKAYPRPKFDQIIEPFAGSARYSLEYFEKEVLLVDKYKVIVDLWKWLQVCSKKDILSLPNMKEGEKVNDYNFDCDQQKVLMGFMCGFSSASPRKTGTLKLTQRPNFINFQKKTIAENLFKIKHWKIRQGHYRNVVNVEATWFIDPPYLKGGNHYVHGSKRIDYSDLHRYSKDRIGQTIVCECGEANWLDFKPLMTQRTQRGPQRELIWTNFPSNYDHTQMQFQF